MPINKIHNFTDILVKMLKQEKSRAAAAEASLHGASVPSDTRHQTVSTKEPKAITNSDTSHHDDHSQNNSSSSGQLSEQRSHRTSHKGFL